MVNRLAAATSPYLLQHKDNPVDWWPWGEEALAEARQRDVPIVLSVGYASCHWCHVMAHESFEHDETARLMNEHFVSIKVDREERPDVDSVYMAVTQALTGQGGWPMTVFCTPEAKPFYAGTYFPLEPRGGHPSFRQILAAVAVGWRDDRQRLLNAGSDVVDRLAAMSGSAGPEDSRPGGAPAPEPLDDSDLEIAVGRLWAEFDQVNGGFGDAPKFPPPMVLEFLVRSYARGGSRQALLMVERTLDRMARGGMYDQLAGGFARYSVDAQWQVPHFEKMLYDNALLLRAYLAASRLPDLQPSAPFLNRVIAETSAFLLQSLRLPDGGFASSLDADVDGVEGGTYLWTRSELVEALGDEDGRWAADLCGLPEIDGAEPTVLQLQQDPEGPAGAERWDMVRARLLKARAERPQPAMDDKVVASWNGLAIAALADAGACLGRDEWVTAATEAAEYLRGVHWRSGRLHRTSRDGVPGSDGVLEDYANLAAGALSLVQATGDPQWLSWAQDLLDVAVSRFGDGRGGWFDTPDDAPALVVRPRDPADGATPSGASALAGACLTYAALTGSQEHRDIAERTVGGLAPLAVRAPRMAGWTAAVAEAVVAGPPEVAVVGDPADEAFRGLLRAARLGQVGGGVVVAGEPGATSLPLLEGRSEVAGKAAAYVCRHFVCQAPVTDEEGLRAELAGPTGVAGP